ncbi:MAG: hypothetical protein PHI97_35220 [Desulfobulbus sp.]|nr:hypothetical protein [Desulfobulbus sp.]
MNTSLESLDQEPDKKREESDRKGKKAIRRMKNPLWGFAWRFLLCCAMIDLPLWAYFHFVKEVPILVGLEQMRNEFQTKKNETVKISTATETKEVKTRYLEINLEKVKQETIAAEKLKLAAEKKKTVQLEPVRQTQTTDPKVYTWINERGQTVYSNQPKK